MPWTRDELVIVRDLLTRLYPAPAVARRVLWDARLETAGYSFAEPASAMWTGIVDQLAAAGDLEAVLAVARREYPKNPSLRALDAARAPTSSAAGGDLESTPRGTWRVRTEGAVDFRKLTGRQWAALQYALVEAFPSFAELAALVRHHLGQNINTIAGSQNINSATYDLIQWSQARGWTERLYRAALAAQPDNPALAEFGLAAQAPASPPGGRPIAESGLERILREGAPTVKLVDLMAQLGAAQARVCRVEVAGDARGTGFLVGPAAVLTCHHVLADVIDGRVPTQQVAIRFDWHPNATGTLAPLHAEWKIAASPPAPFELSGGAGEVHEDQLDYVVLRLREPVGSQPVVAAPAGPGQPARARGWYPLPASAPPVGEKTPLYIVQHPLGRSMEFAMEMEGGARFNAKRTRMAHAVNTEPGSSGAPVFTLDGALVALHHAGLSSVIRANNEAVPIDAIRARLELAGVLDDVDPPAR